VYQFSVNYTPEGSGTLVYLNLFLIGTLVAVLERFAPSFWSKLSALPLTSWLGWTVIVVFSFWTWRVHDFTDHNTFLPAAALWGVALVASFGKGSWRQFLSLKPLRWVGKVSFSMYLFHIPVLMWVKTWPIPTGPLWLLYLGMAALVSALTYLLIERPLQKFKPFQIGARKP
jgi:peptidoglycan/LPS O-acetylase OafA/YrhL